MRRLPAVEKSYLRAWLKHLSYMIAYRTVQLEGPSSQVDLINKEFHAISTLTRSALKKQGIVALTRVIKPLVPGVFGNTGMIPWEANGLPCYSLLEHDFSVPSLQRVKNDIPRGEAVGIPLYYARLRAIALIINIICFSARCAH